MQVLIIKFGALGDLIMDSPIIQSILDAHRDHQVFVLTSIDYTFFFSVWPDVSVRAFSRKSFFSSLGTINWMRQHRFDRIYDLQSNDRSRMMCAFSAAMEIVGNHNHFPYTLNPGDQYRGQCHIFERHNALLQCAGIPAAEAKPCLPVSNEARKTVSDWLQSKSLQGEKLVLMHAGASPRHPQKRWPYFDKLAIKLEQIGYRVVWLGKGEDKTVNASLAKLAGVDACDAFTVEELVALAEVTTFSVSNDSGPMHVLSCANKPVYGLFGPTDWRRNHALGQASHVISLQKPDSVGGACTFPEQEKTSLASISVDMVWDKLVQEKQINP